MPPAVRITDTTNHGGTIIGPGIPTVLIGGIPAAVMSDTHICAIPPSQAHPLTASVFTMGSTTVLIGGMPALRVGDPCLCGASAILGEPTVIIG